MLPGLTLCPSSTQVHHFLKPPHSRWSASGAPSPRISTRNRTRRAPILRLQARRRNDDSEGKEHFHQKPLSSKTTFIKKHFHQTFHQKPFSSKSLSSLTFQNVPKWKTKKEWKKEETKKRTGWDNQDSPCLCEAQNGLLGSQFHLDVAINRPLGLNLSHQIGGPIGVFRRNELPFWYQVTQNF